MTGISANDNTTGRASVSMRRRTTAGMCVFGFVKARFASAMTGVSVSDSRWIDSMEPQALCVRPHNGAERRSTSPSDRSVMVGALPFSRPPRPPPRMASSCDGNRHRTGFRKAESSILSPEKQKNHSLCPARRSGRRRSPRIGESRHPASLDRPTDRGPSVRRGGVSRHSGKGVSVLRNVWIRYDWGADRRAGRRVVGARLRAAPRRKSGPPAGGPGPARKPRKTLKHDKRRPIIATPAPQPLGTRVRIQS